MLLRVGSWNIGNGDRDDLRKLLSICDALALQEASDHDELMSLARAWGYDVIRPDMDGAHATPLIYDPERLDYLKPVFKLVLPKRYIGPGAGPDHNKPKWLIGAKFRHIPSGKRVTICSNHVVPSQYNGLRRKAALDHMRAVHDLFRRRVGRIIVAGDFNCWAKDVELGKRWHCNQTELDELPTHGNRSIDHVWYKHIGFSAMLRRSRLHVFLHRTFRTKSDHDALLVAFDI